MHDASQANAVLLAFFELTPMSCECAIAVENIARAVKQMPILFLRLRVRDDSKGLSETPAIQRS